MQVMRTCYETEEIKVHREDQLAKQRHFPDAVVSVLNRHEAGRDNRPFGETEIQPDHKRSIRPQSRRLTEKREIPHRTLQHEVNPS